MPAPNKDTSHNLLYIDGLRAIAALYVLLHHVVLQYYDIDFHGLTGIKKAGIFSFFFGNLSVDLFIVLSGYCLMRPVIKHQYQLKGGALPFYRRRIVRILPPYYLSIALSLILIRLFVGQKTGTHWDVSLPVTYRDVWSHLFLVHDFFNPQLSKINHSLWSISVECRIYLLFPILVYLWRKVGTGYTLLLSVAASYAFFLCLSYLHTRNSDINLSMPGVNPYLILFCLGMFAADFPDRVKRGNKRLLHVSLLGALVLFVAARHILANSPAVRPDGFLYETINISFGIFCALLLVVCSGSAIGNRLLSWQPLAFVGSFAYSLYLIHAPLVQVLTQYAVAPLQLSRFNATLALALLSLVVILPLSYVFFVACERPFIRLGKKAGIRQAELAAAVNPAP